VEFSLSDGEKFSTTGEVILTQYKIMTERHFKLHSISQVKMIITILTQLLYRITRPNLCLLCLKCFPLKTL